MRRSLLHCGWIYAMEHDGQVYPIQIENLDSPTKAGAVDAIIAGLPVGIQPHERAKLETGASLTGIMPRDIAGRWQGRRLRGREIEKMREAGYDHMWERFAAREAYDREQALQQLNAAPAQHVAEAAAQLGMTAAAAVLSGADA